MHTLTSDPPGKLCGSAGEILNGQFLYTGVEFGDTATAVCDQGSVNASCTTRAHTRTQNFTLLALTVRFALCSYRLVGRATRNCFSKGWDGRVPVCEGEFDSDVAATLSMVVVVSHRLVLPLKRLQWRIVKSRRSWRMQTWKAAKMVPTLTATSSATAAAWGRWSGSRTFGAQTTEHGAPHPPANVRNAAFLIFIDLFWTLFDHSHILPLDVAVSAQNRCTLITN